MLNPAENTDADEQLKYLWNRRSAIQLRALMNRIYYQERQRIFETREGIIKIIAILGGSVAFSTLSTAEIAQWCAAAITFSSAASLVFGFGNKARDSAKRTVEWALLERDIEFAGERNFTESDVNKWAARCNEIESSAPAMHPGLKEKCYLQACASIGSIPIGKDSLSWWHRNCPPLVVH